ncbi:ABC transporter permease [Verticiella sediminum]|uniref:ABC transporter permease n=1 Tax=Verticiella sediminum TaxID=1247510 RepID=A0A556B265_9BURK|nr:ABC transporter permease [Verticiella sediminum]TSH99277.1 ABC transporter permease [Verticiella sediminum]
MSGGFNRYLLRRVLLLVFVLWCILTIMFWLFHFMPGDPTAMFVDANLSPALIERQRELWGLADPVWIQYLRYLRNMVLFDFGTSFFQIAPVSEIMAEKVVNTCLMVVPSLIIAVVLGTLIGAVAGWRRGGLFERAAVGGSLFLHSAPSFFVGILALMVFSYQLRWLPPGGMVSLGGPSTAWGMLFSGDFWVHLLLPCAVLVSREITGPILLLRTSMLEVKGSDFLDILRAKGLPERRIVVHATRNALLPLVTYVAVMTAALFQGQVLLEIIFAWPGIGRELVQALHDLDYPVAQAALYLMALVTLLLNLMADLLYGLIDPRVTYD